MRTGDFCQECALKQGVGDPNGFSLVQMLRGPSAEKAIKPQHSNLKTTMNNFSPRAQQILALARKEAARLNHNYVGTEHLLLGLIKLGQGVAVTALQKLGLNLEDIRVEVEKQVPAGSDLSSPTYYPFTPHIKKVFALASDEAKAMDQAYTGTEHLLLGLLVEDVNAAACVLKTLGLDIDRTRAEVKALHHEST